MSAGIPASARLWRQVLAVVAAAGLFALPALWNGGPLFYPDTPTYLRGAEAGLLRALPPAWQPQPWLAAPTEAPASASASERTLPALSSLEDKTVLAGRSVYYGALLLMAQAAGGLGGVVAFQALALAWVLHLLLVGRWGLPRGIFLGVAAGLAVLTPAGLFAGLLMPDLFAPLAILAAVALMVEGWRLSRGERAGLCGLLVLAVCSHASHLAVVALLLPLALALRRWRPGWEGLWAPGAGRVAACLAVGLAAEFAFQQAVVRTVGAPPLRLPHLTAHLVDLGPGTDYLRSACAQQRPADFAACRYTDRYPVPWTDFLFSTDPGRGVFALADATTRRQLSQEQLALAMAVLRHDPLGTVGGLLADVARQLALVRVDIWGLGPRELAMYSGRVPATVLSELQASRGATAPHWQSVASTASVATVLAAVGFGLARALGLAWPRRRLPHRFAQFAALAVAGVVANAAVCATLAGPLDRFQARVGWLLPLLAVCALALLHHRRASDPAPTTAAGPRRAGGRHRSAATGLGRPAPQDVAPPLTGGAS
jgi:hypothetical protein